MYQLLMQYWVNLYHLLWFQVEDALQTYTGQMMYVRHKGCMINENVNKWPYTILDFQSRVHMRMDLFHYTSLKKRKKRKTIKFVTTYNSRHKSTIKIQDHYEIFVWIVFTINFLRHNSSITFCNSYRIELHLNRKNKVQYISKCIIFCKHFKNIEKWYHQQTWEIYTRCDHHITLYSLLASYHNIVIIGKKNMEPWASLTI